MILLWGIPSEPPVRLAVEAAQRAGIDALVLSQRRAADTDLALSLTDPASGTLVVDTREVALADIAGVYVRLSDPSRLPEHARGAPAARVERSQALHAMLLHWIEAATCRVANKTAPMASNGSKPYQARLLRELGFEIPATIVTDDPQAVLAFEAEHGPLIYKSTSAIRSIVRPFDRPAHERLDRLRRLPTQFQRREVGDDVRVHVVGGTVLAARARTPAVDYRYAGRDGLAVELAACDIPDEVAQRCRAAASALELPFCGIDLLHCDDGRWVALEVNPSPGYSWYEEAAGLPIADALVQWLEHG